MQKQIRTLENRLDKALVKYNEAKAHNKQLRAIIDSLRKERGRTDEIYQQEMLDLQKKQKAIEDLERVGRLFKLSLLFVFDGFLTEPLMHATIRYWLELSSTFVPSVCRTGAPRSRCLARACTG